MMFKRPNIGDVVTVTTRYRENLINATNKWRDTTYENVPVIKGPKWMKPHEFCIPCTGERFITYRVISMKHVHDLEIVGRSAETETTSIKVVEVKGSKGNVYQVTLEDGIAVSCTCPGFQFRRQCRHLKEAINVAKPVSVDLSGKQGDRSHHVSVRKEKQTMSKLKELSWNERFAIFDALNASDEQIMATVGVDAAELATARELRDAGTFVADAGGLNPEDFAAEVSAVQVTEQPAAPAAPTATATRARKTSKPATATKPSREPKKRGRKGTKIQDAFAAISSEPIALEAFAQKFGVSTNVLRQAKRFDRSGMEGRVRVRQVNGTLSIFREDASED